MTAEAARVPGLRRRVARGLARACAIGWWLSVAACTSSANVPYHGPLPKPSPLVKWPEAAGNRGVDNPIWVTGTFDGGMKRYFGVDDLGTAGQSESQEPLFKIADGGTLQNVILGQPAADGVHCQGSCTLINVWWERVGEDAATFRGKSDTATMVIDGGGASGAQDKVFQNNGRGTMIIKNFYVEWFGKLYRSCGNCSKQTRRNVVIENVTAVAGPKTEGLVGLNVNYGDSAEFRGQNHVYDPWQRVPLCLEYEGNSNGSEPRKLGAGKPGDQCRNVDVNVNVHREWK